MNDITPIGETTFRNQRVRFGIKPEDRRRHTYILGKTGVGKTTLIENMIIDDIQKGHGVGFLDPHGESALRILDFVPASRINDIIYFDPSDLDHPIGFNILERVGTEYRHIIASGVMSVFKKIWPDVWSARMEYILNNAVLALLEAPNSTLLGIARMLADKEYRKKVVERIADPVVKSFWGKEFVRYSQTFEVEATAAIQNKVGQFISAPVIRNIIGQVYSAIDMRKVMDEGRILILNISKGRIGEDNARLLGGLLVTRLQLAAMSRVDVPELERRDFYLYVDEFQNFATESFANILSEARKYRLNLILAHQYLAQLDEAVQPAVFGNVGTIICFRIGAEDAELLEKEFEPEFRANDLLNLAKYDIYIKLMIDGIASKAFSATTFSPLVPPEDSDPEKILRVSQERYGAKREDIEDKISRWYQPMFAETTSLSSGSKKSHPQSDSRPETRQHWKAACSICGKSVEVPFEPDGKRSVYCKEHLASARREVAHTTQPKVAPDTAGVRQAITEALETRTNPSPKEEPKG